MEILICIMVKMVTLNFISFHNYASFYVELVVYAQPYSEIYNVKVKDYIESYFSKHFAIYTSIKIKTTISWTLLLWKLPVKGHCCHSSNC